MAGKNTAAFGIYKTQVGAEQAVDALKTAGFRNTTSRHCYLKTKARKISLTRRTQRHQKELLQEPGQAQSLVAHSAGSLVSVR